ncbi:hypothetical protein [Flavobacterium olei]|uniref:hypothetical protein n=1 Tax=Flavobacterium olei TaxID=1886782 RepID=UPI003219C83C
MSHFKTFTLSPTRPKITFKCQHSFSGVKILKIDIPFLSDKPPHLWLGWINGVYLNFTSISTNGSVDSFAQPLTLINNQIHPTFVVNFFFPTQNENNMQSLPPFCNQFEVLLVAPYNTKDFEVTVVYEEMPGVIII